MSGYDIAFYAFSLLTLLCGVLVITNRNPVTSAMFLVLTIVCMAGLFVLLRAFFLAAVQILVYAGAVMVLFLFVIMLLDLKEEARRRIKKNPAGDGRARGACSDGDCPECDLGCLTGNGNSYCSGRDCAARTIIVQQFSAAV